MLHHQKIKMKGQNVDSANNMVIRELQEELSNARTQLDRWKNQAIQGKSLIRIALVVLVI